MATLRTRIVMGWLAIALGLAAVILVACSSSDQAASSAPDADAQSSPATNDGSSSADSGGRDVGTDDTGDNDAAGNSDTGTTDAGSDTGTTDAADAGNDGAVSIPTNGLVAYYRGDGTDKSGNANNLTGGMSLAPDRFGASQAGSIVSSEFGSKSGNNPLIPAGAAPFSISAWARVEVLQGLVPLLQWGTAGTLQLRQQGQDELVLFKGSAANGSGDEVASTKALSLAQWHHIVLTFDSANAKLFIDNVSDMSMAIQFGSSSTALTMGFICYPNGLSTCPGSTGFTLGSIDDVRVYSRVLTVPEIDALYHEAK